MPGAGPASTPSSASVPQGVDRRPAPAMTLKVCRRSVPTSLRSAVIAGTFEYADFAVPLPDLDFVSSGLTLRGGNGAFVGDAVNVSRVGNSIAVIKEIQTIMCHTPSVFLWPRGSTKPAEAI